MPPTSPREFCLWLSGYFEISGGDGGLSRAQAAAVRERLAAVVAAPPRPCPGGCDAGGDAYGAPAAGA
jgi:hypothetical protein